MWEVWRVQQILWQFRSILDWTIRQRSNRRHSLPDFWTEDGKVFDHEEKVTRHFPRTGSHKAWLCFQAKDSSQLQNLMSGSHENPYPCHLSKASIFTGDSGHRSMFLPLCSSYSAAPIHSVSASVLVIQCCCCCLWVMWGLICRMSHSTSSIHQ